ncbi:tetratricopeptide repeat protein 19, mitochondrial isoform X1 [Syngnathus acus]|uniref:tetratricopeptide repeat protein 19, mitochondrial isoform X1 n=2 Tax=Syngnathus acus TaxID=161584 RepID=UPI00188616F5|nr:tetratricopeptide repeat protein 19, mitochondrial isoform X1 [Syngnathus acus]
MATTCAQTLRRACRFMFGRPGFGASGSILPSLCFRNAPPCSNGGVLGITGAASPQKGGSGGQRRRRGETVWTAATAAFLFFGSSEEVPSSEEELILLLKKAKLSMLRGELEAASSFLHAAAAIAQRERHQAAIIYTYSQMANLAYVQGHMTQAEKLFKATMSHMLANGTPEDDNAFVEMSLKLATMYAQENKTELAEHGFRFCFETLESKVQTLETTPADERTEADEVLRKDTHLLLGLCLDSHARYLAATKRLTQAAAHYRRALDICRQEQGPHHHQTLVLMSDLATILDMQGRHDDALALISQAVDGGRVSGHQDLHVLLANMAALLLHAGRRDDGLRTYREALDLAREVDDGDAVRHILQNLSRATKTDPSPEEAEQRAP